MILNSNNEMTRLSGTSFRCCAFLGCLFRFFAACCAAECAWA